MVELDDLPGNRILAIAHPLRDVDGFEYVDLVTSTAVYRFSSDEVDGELTDGGWTMDHYSLGVSSFEIAETSRQAPALPVVVVNVEKLLCDEWLGPVDPSLPADGVDPRSLFDGPPGSAPAGTPHVAVTRGIIVTTDGPSILVATSSFPRLVDYTTEPNLIAEFRARYER